ncbi:hypothetical protein BJ165DRAFT_1532801 [Panaeolus papilionaceus]|nr:hypothetical protein BJ165DRAFT_1532801 [Panaeolus papilionaceus]
MPSLQPQKEALKEFVRQDPNSDYTFDSQQGSQESELCRGKDRDSEECLKLRMTSTDMFKAMQDQGFFCSLPIDPERTYMECKPLPK